MSSIHKHKYVYNIDYTFTSTLTPVKLTYTLLTNHSGPNSKVNRDLLEQALRIQNRKKNWSNIRFLYDKVRSDS